MNYSVWNMQEVREDWERKMLYGDKEWVMIRREDRYIESVTPVAMGDRYIGLGDVTPVMTGDRYIRGCNSRRDGR